MVVSDVKSDWWTVVSGAPRGPGLGEIVFNTVINDLDNRAVAPSASLQMTPQWGDGTVDVPVRGTSTGWGNVLTGTSRNSAKASAESCTWDGTTPSTNTG